MILTLILPFYFQFLITVPPPKWKAHRISGPWVVTGSQTAWDTVNGPVHDLSWSEPRFQHLSSLLQFFLLWMTVKIQDWRAEVTCGHYAASLPAQILHKSRPSLQNECWLNYSSNVCDQEEFILINSQCVKMESIQNVQYKNRDD